MRHLDCGVGVFLRWQNQPAAGNGERGYQTQPEPGQQIVAEQLQFGGDELPWLNQAKFVELCVARGMSLYNAVPANSGVTLSDRSILDNIAALGRDGVIPPHFVRAMQEYRYADVVFLTPPWRELFDQSSRQHTFEEATAEYESLVELYPAMGYEIVIVPQGSISERADWLEGEVSKLNDRSTP